MGGSDSAASRGNSVVYLFPGVLSRQRAVRELRQVPGLAALLTANGFRSRNFLSKDLLAVFLSCFCVNTVKRAFLFITWWS